MPSTTCAYCQRAAHFTIRWGSSEQDGDRVRIAATCDYCGNLSVAMGESPHMSIPDTTDLNAIRRASESFEDYLTWWPQIGYSPQIEDVPEHIARAAREAYSSASVGNHMAAILMARTVVEATAKAKGITGSNLKAKIDGLRDQQFIRPAIAEQAHEVRFSGNDMAHGDIDLTPDSTDAEEILALMAEVLSEVFQGPARLERIRAKRAATDRR